MILACLEHKKDFRIWMAQVFFIVIKVVKVANKMLMEKWMNFWRFNHKLIFSQKKYVITDNYKSIFISSLKQAGFGKMGYEMLFCRIGGWLLDET